MFSSKFLTPPLLPPLPLVNVAVVQGSPAHYVSPFNHDKTIRESFHPGRGKEYVNEHAAQYDELDQRMEQVFKQRNLICPPSTSQYPDSDAPDPPPTITATDVPSTSVSYPLPVFLEWGTSCEDVIMNEPSTVPGTGIGEHIGHASCIDCHQPVSQITSLRFLTANPKILLRMQCEKVCTRTFS